MYDLEWTETAWRDIDQLSDYLIDQEEDFQAAEDMVKQILQAPERLTVMPWSGTPGRVPGTRELLVRKTRYSLVYSVLIPRCLS